MDQELNKQKKILITGGLGFLGVNLILSLIKIGIKPYVVDIYQESVFEDNIYIPFKLNQIFYYNTNLQDNNKTVNLIKSINPDVVVHAAALTVLNRDYQTAINTIEINIKTTINILEAMKAIPKAKLIFISTSDIYGEVDPPFKESQLCIPASPYSISKLTCEHYCIMYCNIHKFPLIILRVFNIFGKYQKGGRVIPYIIKDLLENKPVKLTPGEQKREYNYIENISDAIIASIENNDIEREIINIGSSHSVKIKDIALKIANVLNKQNLLLVSNLIT